MALGRFDGVFNGPVCGTPFSLSLCRDRGSWVRVEGCAESGAKKSHRLLRQTMGINQCVVIIDNDYLGHNEGNYLTKSLARRLIGLDGHSQRTTILIDGLPGGYRDKEGRTYDRSQR